jgi:hypothetical protein
MDKKFKSCIKINVLIYKDRCQSKFIIKSNKTSIFYSGEEKRKKVYNTAQVN